MIKVNNLTLTYPSGKGVFDLNFNVQDGEVLGYLGPNGAGKTTTIRALMGFMRSDKGLCSIKELDCFKSAPQIQKDIGYIPGEISFIEKMDGDEFLNFIADMRGIKNLKKKQELLEILELNPKGKISKFSKGMKQKLGIVSALMHDPQILILDEPTSGLDPLMQKRFVDLILAEKKRGKTVLLSSHMFEEVQRTCDSVIIIKDGRIVKKSDVNTLKSGQIKEFIVEVSNTSEALKLLKQNGFRGHAISNVQFEVLAKGVETDSLIKVLAQMNIISMDIKAQALEDVFLSLYAKEEKKS